MPASTLTVAAKVLGSRKRPFEDWSVPLPPTPDDRAGGEPYRLRDLITWIVRQEVAAFNDRQEARRLPRVLSPDEIAQGARVGRIDSGGRDPGPRADAEQAVGVALEAFEDGLYLVLIDGTECRDLDAEVHPEPDSRVTFLRLTFLAGG